MASRIYYQHYRQMVRKAVFLIPKTVIRPLGSETEIFLIRFLDPFCIIDPHRAEAV